MALALLLVVPLACGGEGNEPGTSARTPTGASVDSQTTRSAAIYASVIRQLVTKDHTFGGADPGFKVVYVMDGVIDSAGDVGAPVVESAGKAFTEPLKAELRRALSDLPPVEFVGRRDSVVVGSKGGASPGHVKNRGVLITLGPIEVSGTSVRVGNTLWISGLAGRWQTYVLERRGSAWSVTGTTGPVAIS